jgi:hypothetical protein
MTLVQLRAASLACVGPMLWSASAHSQPEPSAAHAAQLFEEGRAFSQKGDFPDACDRFAQSYALDSATGTELNLGDCEEHLAHFAEAWRRFDDATVRLEAAHDARVAFARQRRDSLRKRVGVVIVRVADPSTHVAIAGRDEPTGTEVVDHVDPGNVDVRIATELRRVHVEAGATTVVEFFPLGSPDRDAGESRRRDRVLIAGIVGGAGLVTGAIAVGVVLDARSRYDQELSNGDCTRTTGAPKCNPTGVAKQNSAITLANVGTGLAIGAVVALGAGAVLYFTAPHDSINVAPTATPTSVGVTVGGSF